MWDAPLLNCLDCSWLIRNNRRVNTNIPGELHQIPQTGYDMYGINRVLSSTTILIILGLVIVCIPVGFLLGFLLGRQSRVVHNKPYRKVLNMTDLTRLSAIRNASGYENFTHIDRKWNPEVMLNHTHTKEGQFVLNGWAASTIKPDEPISMQNQHKSSIEQVLLTDDIPYKTQNVTEVVINTLHPRSNELTKCTDPILLWKFPENNNSQSHLQLTADSLSFAHKSLPSSQTDDESLDV
ncbi:hypothetical protein AHF37_03651 [Paragonimus kellicotti]|nr:hypothetical protein AHF37_03651 [Paragonimus kellicotti]